MKSVIIFSLMLITISSWGQKKWEHLQSTANDSLYNVESRNYEKGLSKKDTLLQIESLIAIAYFFGSQAKYKDSYDNLWKALSLANESKNLSATATINQKLGRHFGYYGRKEEALVYFQIALQAQEEIIKVDPTQKFILADTYHQMCSFYRDLNEPLMQKQCIDSCKKYIDRAKKETLFHLLTMEEAVVSMKNQQYQKSKNLFDQAYSYINNNLETYLVLFEYYQGVNYYHLNKTIQAEEKLNHALEVAYKYKAHLDFVPKIYQKLSQIYLDKGRSSKAIDMLNKMAEVNFLFFDSRSVRNKSLLEIQDEQRLLIEEQKKEMQQLRLEELEYAGEALFFQRAILIIGILLLGLFAFIYVKYLTKKYRLEKELTNKKQEIEFEKVQEIIELKNKELATSALKLIEKDEIVEEFASSLKKKNWQADSKELKQFIRSWDLNINRNWDEFQQRFTSINSSFFKNLHNNYPILSASDDKLCALIKLKLSSKEISRLLGISNESVQVKRSRLRTKLGLEREINLTEFIDNF